MDITTQNIGENVRRFRSLRGLTQGELAEKSGVSKQTVYAIEQARVEDPRVGTLRQIAHALGVSLLALVPDLNCA